MVNLRCMTKCYFLTHGVSLLILCYDPDELELFVCYDPDSELLVCYDCNSESIYATMSE